MNQSTEKSNSINLSPYKDIFEAAEKGTIEDINNFFGETKTNVRKLVEDGETPLHRAVSKNSNIDITKYLISQGANVNAVNEKGETPLHGAVRYSNAEVVKCLISQGADVNANMWNFYYGTGTPLSYAKTEDIKSILREAGAQ